MAASPEGQLPGMRNGQRVGAIIVRGPVILPPIQVVRERATGFTVGHGFAIGIANQEVQTRRHAFLQLGLQRVRAGVIAVAGFVDSLRKPELLEEEAAGVVVVAATHGARRWIAVWRWRS